MIRVCTGNPYPNTHSGWWCRHVLISSSIVLKDTFLGTQQVENNLYIHTPTVKHQHRIIPSRPASFFFDTHHHHPRKKRSFALSLGRLYFCKWPKLLMFAPFRIKLAVALLKLLRLLLLLSIYLSTALMVSNDINLVSLPVVFVVVFVKDELNLLLLLFLGALAALLFLLPLYSRNPNVHCHSLTYSSGLLLLATKCSQDVMYKVIQCLLCFTALTLWLMKKTQSEAI